MKEKTFTQKFEGFFKLVNKNPEMSFNNLQKLAVKKGVSFKRQDMQEEFRLIKNVPKKTEQAYRAPRRERELKDVKKHSDRYAKEAGKENLLKLKKQKRIEKSFDRTKDGSQVKRFRTPIKEVPNPQQFEEAMPVAYEVAERGYNYFVKKCKARAKLLNQKKGYVQAQLQLSGYVEIYRNEASQTEANLIYAGSVQSLSRIYGIGKMSPEFFVSSWVDSFSKMLQSMDGYFRIKSFYATATFWGRQGEKI